MRGVGIADLASLGDSATAKMRGFVQCYQKARAETFILYPQGGWPLVFVPPAGIRRKLSISRGLTQTELSTPGRRGRGHTIFLTPKHDRHIQKLGDC